jgi:hypothetical protein
MKNSWRLSGISFQKPMPPNGDQLKKYFYINYTLASLPVKTQGAPVGTGFLITTVAIIFSFWQLHFEQSGKECRTLRVKGKKYHLPRVKLGLFYYIPAKWHILNR